MLLEAAEVDVVVVALAMVNQMYPVDDIADDVIRLSRDAAKPVLVSWVASSPKGAEKIETAGLPVFTESTGCLKALAARVRFGETPAAPSPVTAAGGEPVATAEARRVIEAAGPGPLDEHDSTALLATYGVPTAAERLVTTADEAVAAAEALGYPVALKACSGAIPHKSDLGLVSLGLRGGAEVRTACAELQSRLRDAFPHTPIRGLLVQRMAPPGGVEVALGAKRDGAFGPVVMVALGGVFIEYLDDAAFGLAPVSRDQALALIRSLRTYPLLAGARGRAPVDEDALADSLVSLSRLAFDLRPWIREIDVNPLIALPQGQGVLAVDALIVLAGRS